MSDTPLTQTRVDPLDRLLESAVEQRVEIAPGSADKADRDGKSLTGPEQGRLVELESVIDQGLKSFVDVGLALKEIRDSKLYREQHRTFESYCRKRWVVSRIHGHRMIEAALVAEMLPVGNERQARELIPLSTEERLKVWALVTAPGSPPPTAKRIRKVILAEGLLDKPRNRKRRREAKDGGVNFIFPLTISLPSDTDIVTPDTDPEELAALIRTSLGVFKNSHNETWARFRVQTVGEGRVTPSTAPIAEGTGLT
jgi:hypothetical protein